VESATPANNDYLKYNSTTKRYEPGAGTSGPDNDAIHDNVASEISAITEKTSLVGADLVIIEDSEAANVKKKVQVTNLPGGTDADAIHDNVAAEISAITEKTTPVSADLVIIEDSAAANVKKKVQVGNLPTGSDSDAIHDNVSGEIVAIVEKTTLVGADEFLVEDSAASNIKKSAKISAIRITESQVTDLDHTDADAIHDNVAAEISAVTEKVSPVSADLLLIEDSAAANVKKKVQIGNLPTGLDADAIHDNVASEISAITEKLSPAGTDIVIIEDVGAGNAKKKVQLGNLPGGVAGATTAKEVSGTYALDIDDPQIINCDSSAGSVTVNLPATTAGSRWFFIHRDGANLVTINRNGTDTFDDGRTSQTLEWDGSGVMISCIGDGEWKILDKIGNVSDRSRWFVDPVRDFNCPTDGTSDCLAAFNAAAAAAQPSQGGPGLMMLPGGTTFAFSDTFKQLAGVAVRSFGTGKGDGNQDIEFPKIITHSSWVGGDGSVLWQFGNDGTGSRFNLQLEGVFFRSVLTGADFVDWMIEAPGKVDSHSWMDRLTVINEGGGGIHLAGGALNAWFGDIRFTSHTLKAALQITCPEGAHNFRIRNLAWHSEGTNPALEGAFKVVSSMVNNQGFFEIGHLHCENESSGGLVANHGIITLQAANTGNNPNIMCRVGSMKIAPNNDGSPLFWIGRQNLSKHDDGFILEFGPGIGHAGTAAKLIDNTTIPSPTYDQMFGIIRWQTKDIVGALGSPDIVSHHVGHHTIRNLGIGENAVRGASDQGDGVAVWAEPSSVATDAPTGMAVMQWDNTAKAFKYVDDGGTVRTITAT
jgi:hypothetical protein